MRDMYVCMYGYMYVYAMPMQFLTAHERHKYILILLENTQY